MPDPSTDAPLWLRLAAALYDLFPLIGLWMLTAAIALWIAGDVDAAHPSHGFRLSEQIALVAVTAIYFVLSWTRGGQTIGMRAWRTRVVTAAGMPPAWPRALLRFAVALVSLGAVGAGFLWCLVDRDRRAWHDIAAGTWLVRLPHAPKAT